MLKFSSRKPHNIAMINVLGIDSDNPYPWTNIDNMIGKGCMDEKRPNIAMQ